MNNKIKVMFIMDRVCHYHVPLFTNLEKRLRENDSTLILLSGEPAHEETGRAGIKDKIIDNQYIYRFQEWRIKGFTFRRWKGVSKIMKSIKPDCVIMPSHVGNVSSWLAQNIAESIGAKVVAWQCGYEYNDSFLKRLVLKTYLNRFDFHLAYHTNAKNYVEALGVPSNKVVVTHNTINESAIKTLDAEKAREIIFSKHASLKGKRIILFVGAVLKEKRIDIVVNALDIIKRDDCVFVVIGDGPYLSTLVKEFGHRSDVEFLGKIVSGVDVYFDSADVFVLTGTGGLAINEAMMHRLPIISSYADGSADDLVIHNVNGYRLNNGTPEELAGYLSAILSDNELRKDMGSESRRMITEEYSFESFLNRVLPLISKTCC